MGMEKQRLSECEAILMRILWEEDCDMSMQELRAEALENYGKDWAKQTVSTFLKRMEESGYLEGYKEGSPKARYHFKGDQNADERPQSDIIYFATAVPESLWN